jgi:predicted transcriptional regulator of viral defense system
MALIEGNHSEKTRANRFTFDSNYESRSNTQARKNILAAKISELWLYLQSEYNNLEKMYTASSIKEWINQLQQNGKLYFSIEQVAEAFPRLQPTGIRSALSRLSAKSHIVSVWKGFYVIVPISYLSKGILPPVLYIDHLMKHLQRPYYVGLLNAAAFYGAALQQPQRFSVVVQHPTLRDNKKKDNHMQFIARRNFPTDDLLEMRKTQTGYVQISTALLTAADIVQYEKKVGGLNRACTVLNDLTESLDFTKTPDGFFDMVSTATIQRLGYLLERVLDSTDLANQLYEKAMRANCNFQSIPLKTGKAMEAHIQDKKWKIVINTEIEMDE